MPNGAWGKRGWEKPQAPLLLRPGLPIRQEGGERGSPLMLASWKQVEEWRADLRGQAGG